LRKGPDNTKGWGARLLVVGVVLVLAPACNNDTTTPTSPPTTTPTPAPSPIPPPATVVLEGSKMLEAPGRGKGTYAGWDFTTDEAGTLQVSVSYVHDDSKVLVWVTDRLCNRYQFQRDECSYLTKSVAGSNPRELAISGVAAGGYSLYVSNDGPYDEQVLYEVRVTPGASATARSTTASTTVGQR